MPGPKALTNQIVSSAHDDVGLWAQVGPKLGPPIRLHMLLGPTWAHVIILDIEKLETVFDAGPEF